jgi:uncharacterized protein (UPF0332 family)
MDIAARRTYVRLRLERAVEDLASAQDDLGHKHPRAAVNRSYYAVFHMASAALLWLDVEPARHSGVQSAFGEHLVKPGLIEPEFGAILGRARRLREAQDYDLDAEELTNASARVAVEDAQRFVERTMRYLRDAGALDDT